MIFELDENMFVKSTICVDFCHAVCLESLKIRFQTDFDFIVKGTPYPMKDPKRFVYEKGFIVNNLIV